jgi:histidinol-phosphate/aromatic aminotransferase/cobyric acid decarboxylase-like protein
VPTLLYRRLFPSLRRLGERGSVRHPASVVFVDDDEATVRRKFMGAVTGGRASATEQRARGGDPTRCAAFAMVELLCTETTAETALLRCQSGEVLCASCKNEYAGPVYSGLREAVGSTVPAGQFLDVRDSVPQAATDVRRLPRREPAGLESAIAAKVDVSPDQVVVGSGSAVVMDWLFHEQSKSAAGDTVVATEPTFELYRDLAERHQLHYVSVPWDQAELSHDVQALSRAASQNAVLCVLDIPHSVSGAGFSAALIDPIARALRPGAVLLLDMVAADFMRSQPGPAAQLLDRYPNAVVCGSLSKVHHLPGIRVGYALTAAPMAGRLRKHRLPYSVDSLSLAAVEAALNDEGARLRTVSASHKARDRLTGVLRQLGVRYAPTESYVLLMELGSQFESVAYQLASMGASFRDGRRWGMTGWMQVPLIDTESTEAVIDVLRRTARDDNEQA